MKNLITPSLKQICLFVLILSFHFKSSAQTVLSAGDIAFSGYISADGSSADQFSFVLLKNITANTVIKFTDYGWDSGTNTLNAGATITESEIIFTATTALNAGQEIKIVGTSVTITGPGTATIVYSVGGSFLAGNLSLASNGDQVLAYQGNFPAPTTFIAGIHMNVDVFANAGDPPTSTAAAWDGLVPVSFRNNNHSALPPGLTTGVNCIWIGTEGMTASERDNGRFTCGPDVSSTANARAALNNQANWATSNSPGGTFTLPSGCVFGTSVAATFSTQPVASNLCASLSASFNVATDQSGMSFVWQEASTVGFASPTNLSNGGLYTISSSSNTSTLTISDNTTKNGKFYRCVGTNSGALITNSSIVGLTATANLLSGTVSFNQTVGPGNASLFFASGCRLLAKVVPGNISGNVNVDSWLEGAVPSVVGVPFVQRHYQITPAAGTTATVTLYFSQTDFNNYNGFNASTIDNIPTGAGDAIGKANLRITKYNGSSNDFTGLPASYTSGSSIIDPVDSDIFYNADAARWEVKFDVSGFSGFTVQSAVTAPLPVKLVSFVGKINEEKSAELNWKVAEQVDIQEYNIEKSMDAISFSSIGKVISNKQSKTDYDFTDSDLVVGKNYYRLKIVEQNGSLILSKIIALNFKPEISVTLYPNPTAELLSIDQIGDYKNQKADLFNEKGFLVKSFNLKKDSNISLKDLPNGVYILKLSDGKSFKVLKNN